MKKIILCDLDGTLADCHHRIHFILGTKRWDKFFAACGDDKPIKHVIDLINAIDRKKYEVWITSARSDEVFKETVSWLDRHNVVYERLIMRKAGDHTDDGDLKPSWLEDGTIPRDRVAFSIDDRDRVVSAWRKAGIPCFQCADGNF